MNIYLLSVSPGLHAYPTKAIVVFFFALNCLPYLQNDWACSPACQFHRILYQVTNIKISRGLYSYMNVKRDQNLACL